MKKLLTVLLLLSCILLSLTPASAIPKRHTCGDYVYVFEEDGTVMILRWDGTDRDLAVPETLDGFPVTGIGPLVFSGKGGLVSVTLPEGIVRMTNLCFYACPDLVRVSLPDSLAEIGINPFSHCPALTDIAFSPDHPFLELADGVLFTRPDRCLVSYPFSFSAESYAVPEGTETIGSSAFSGCENLVSVTIPDSVTRVEDGAFQDCVRLSSAVVPDSVKDLGWGVFAGCTGLVSAVLPKDLVWLGAELFSGCSALADFTMPETVESIGSSAFMGCESLASVTIPDGVLDIGEAAFWGCAGLTEVSIPDSVITLMPYAFEYCGDITLVIGRENEEALSYCEDAGVRYIFRE